MVEQRCSAKEMGKEFIFSTDALRDIEADSISRLAMAAIVLVIQQLAPPSASTVKNQGPYSSR